MDRLGRRAFLRLVVAAPLLKLAPSPIFVPRYYAATVSVTLVDIQAVECARILPAVVDTFFAELPSLRYVQDLLAGRIDG